MNFLFCCCCRWSQCQDQALLMVEGTFVVIGECRGVSPPKWTENRNSIHKNMSYFIYSTKTFNYNLRSNFVKIDFHLLARSDMCFHLHLFVHCLVSICVKSRKKSSRSFVFVRAPPSISFICCPQSFWQLTRTWVQSPVILPISLCGRFGLSSLSFGHRTMCFRHILSYPSCREGVVKLRWKFCLLDSSHKVDSWSPTTFNWSRLSEG